MYSDTISCILHRSINKKLEGIDTDYLIWNQGVIDAYIKGMTNVELIEEISFAVAEAINELRIG